MHTITQKEAFRCIEAGIAVERTIAGGSWVPFASEHAICDTTSYRIAPEARFPVLVVMIEPPPSGGWWIPVALLNGSIEEQLQEHVSDGDMLYIETKTITGEEFNNAPEFDGY